MEARFSVGDMVRVFQKISEGEKTRTQIFEGTVIRIDQNAKSYTVRRVADGVGVEKIWSFVSPWVEKVIVKKHVKKIRRAKLYYLRDLTEKESARVVA